MTDLKHKAVYHKKVSYKLLLPLFAFLRGNVWYMTSAFFFFKTTT